jgi:protein gp37
MGDTEISWTHRPGTRGRSWNPTQGCSRVSEGCRACYAERLAARFAETGWSQGLINLKTRKWNGVVRLASHKLADPLRWREPSTVFVNSMSDLFHETLTNEQIAAVFGVMAATPRHTYQILTKRARRMREWFEWVDATCMKIADSTNPWWRVLHCLSEAGYAMAGDDDAPLPGGSGATWPLGNVWLGTSTENQPAADERIPDLLATPAAVRFLSVEPMLGPVDLRCVQHERTFEVDALTGDHGVTRPLAGRGPRVDWIICGAESGPGARPMDHAWARSLRDQCRAAGVAFFVKQLVVNGKLRKSIDEFPEDLRFQEFPS